MRAADKWESTSQWTSEIYWTCEVILISYLLTFSTDRWRMSRKFLTSYRMALLLVSCQCHIRFWFESISPTWGPPSGSALTYGEWSTLGLYLRQSANLSLLSLICPFECLYLLLHRHPYLLFRQPVYAFFCVPVAVNHRHPRDLFPNVFLQEFGSTHLVWHQRSSVRGPANLDSFFHLHSPPSLPVCGLCAQVWLPSASHRIASLWFQLSRGFQKYFTYLFLFCLSFSCNSYFLVYSLTNLPSFSLREIDRVLCVSHIILVILSVIPSRLWAFPSFWFAEAPMCWLMFMK